MKRIFAFFLMMFCAILTFAQSPEAWAAYEKARRHYNAKNFDDAIVDLEEAIKHSPDFYSAYHTMASSYHELGDVKKALENYEKIIGKKDLNGKSLDERAWYNIGLLYVKDKQLDKGAEAFDKALEINPNYQKAKFQIGLLDSPPMNPALRTATHLYKQRKYQEGLDETYNIEADNVDADVYYWRGNFLKKLNKKDEALEQYKQAVSFDDKHGEAHAQLGVLYFRGKNYDTAYEYLAKASELNPDDHDLMHDTGISAYHLGDYLATIDWLTKYLEKNPEGRAAHYRLAAAYSEMEYEALAQQHLQTSADLGYPLAVKRMEEGFNEYKKIDYTTSMDRTTVNRGRTDSSLNVGNPAPKTSEKKMTKKERKAAKKREKKARKATKKVRKRG